MCHGFFRGKTFKFIDFFRMPVPVCLRLNTCRIPDDCIDKNRYPLFMARAVLQELIESLQLTTGSAKP